MKKKGVKLEQSKCPDAQTIRAMVVKNVKFSEDNFVLELLKPEGFSYKAGQFMMLHINGSQKPFSIASSPSEKTLKFLIKEHKDGAVTPFLLNLKEGDFLELTGPFGRYEVKKTESKIFFIAAGTGVAPFRGMIIDYLAANPKARVTLIFGFRIDCYFEEDFRTLEEGYPNFEVVGCSTGESKDWRGLRGRVTEHLEELIKDNKDKEIYICGSRTMVEDVKSILLEKMNFQKSQIRIEEW